jgi:hypothetical protein
MDDNARFQVLTTMTRAAISYGSLDQVRRSLIGVALSASLGALIGCRPKAEQAFSATFDVIGTGRIALDFIDDANYRFVPAIGSGATVVLGGRIYITLIPSLATGGKGRTIWVGELMSKSPPHDRSFPKPQIQPVTPPSQLYWTPNMALHEVWVPRSDSTSDSSRITVANLPALAKAQFLIDTMLRPAMDMSLCGDGVSRLIGCWPRHLTGQGLAVLAHSDGVRLQESIRAMTSTIELPQDQSIEDYRILPR